MSKFLMIVATLLGLSTAMSAAEPASQQVASFSSFAPQQMAKLPRGNALETSKAKVGNLSLEALNEKVAQVLSANKQASTYATTDITGTRTAFAHTTGGIVRTSQSTVTEAGEGKVKVENFLVQGVNFTADVDEANSTFSIQPQTVYTIDDNKLSICPLDIDNMVYDPNKPVVGSIIDGNMYIDGGFGIFVVEGPNKGANLNIGLMTYGAIATPNVTITNNIVTFANNSMTQENRTVTPTEVNGLVHQTSTTSARLIYLPITGSNYIDMEMTLLPNNKIEVAPQRAYASLYWFYIYPASETADDTGKINVSAQLISPVKGTFSHNTIRFGEWILGNTGAGVMSIIEKTEAKLTGSLTFPKSPAFDLEGDGTAENPYKIASTDDWAKINYAVSNNVNIRTAATDSLDENSSYYRVFDGKYFQLTADLDYTNVKEPSTPAGDKQFRFAGVLDGNGHVIKKFRIDNYAYDYCGLFGAIDSHGVVKNLTLESPRITTLGYNCGHIAGRNYGVVDNVKVTGAHLGLLDGYSGGGITGYNYGKITNSSHQGYITGLGMLGGIAGRNYNLIENCNAKGNIYMTGAQVFAGGIAGQCSMAYVDAAKPVITRCWYSGNITAPKDEIGLGGIAGQMGYGTISQCFAVANLASLSSRQSMAGGIAGSVFSATIENCYVAGSVYNTESALVGGIVGHGSEYTSSTSSPAASVIKTSYSSVVLDTKSADARRGVLGDPGQVPATITNCFYDTQMANVEHATHGKLTSAMTTTTALSGFDKKIWTFAAGMYPRLTEFKDLDVAVISATPLLLANEGTVKRVSMNPTYPTTNGVEWAAIVNGYLDKTGGHAFKFDNGTLKISNTTATDTVIVMKNDFSRYFILNIAPIEFVGQGTEEDPWQIASREDMHKLISIADDAHVDFNGLYLRLMADIDMQGDTIRPIANDKISTPRTGFKGTFDGNGKTIDNFRVLTVGYTAAGVVDPKSTLSTYNSGLFGVVLAGGTVKNLTIGPKAQFECFSTAGAIVGHLYGGRIENCTNYGNVTAFFSDAAGIAGKASLATSEIVGCYNAGTVYAGYSNAGGIVGTISAGSVSNSQNAGNVAAEFINPYQAAGRQMQAGGIAAVSTNGKFTDVINTGNVSSLKSVGGIIGKNTSTAATEDFLTNAVNIGQVTSSDLASGGQIVGDNTLGVPANAYYDRQRNQLGAVSNSNPAGCSAMNSADLASTKPELSSNWTKAEGYYPVLAQHADKAEAKLAAASVVEFAASNKASFVTLPATLKNTDVVTWSVKSGDNFSIATGTLNVTIPDKGLAAKDVLVATIGSLTRELPLTTLNTLILPGEGTENDPFIIASADDMMTLSNFMEQSAHDFEGSWFKVTADSLDFTDIEYVPVGIGSAFNGIFLGNGTSINNLTYSATASGNSERGLFATIGRSGKVDNVVIDSSSSFSAYNRVGGIAGGNYGTITNCVNKGAISATGTLQAGGIAGFGYANSVITDCKNLGKVTAKTNNAGGILGASLASSGVTISNSTNEGEISGAASCGGIVGSASAFIDNCANLAEGSVTVTGNYAAGIAGDLLYPSSVKKSYNEGTVNAKGYAAGIAGQSAAHRENHMLAIDSCYNSSDITSGATGYAAGIITKAAAGTVITNCYNVGDITSGGNYGAGIGASVSATAAVPSNVENCYNTGAIKANNQAGGITANFDGKSTLSYIKKSYNTGSVTITGNYAGGISGNYIPPVYDCWNAGDITGGQYVGGLNGQHSSNPYAMERCFNVGAIKATKTYAGGLIGQGRPLMVDCYNLGEVSATDVVGGIIATPAAAHASTYTVTFERTYNASTVNATTGTNVGNISAYNSNCEPQYLKIGTDVYFDSTLSAEVSYDKTIGAKGRTSAEMAKLELGDNFSTAANCYPWLTSQSTNDYNMLYVPQVVFNEGEDAQNVKTFITVGMPAGVTWTCTPNLSISEDGKVTIVACEEGEEASLTLHAGELTRTFPLILMQQTSAIDGIGIDGESVVKEEYYSINGMRLSDNVPAGTIVVVRRYYSDGTVATSKEVIR